MKKISKLIFLFLAALSIYHFTFVSLSLSNRSFLIAIFLWLLIVLVLKLNYRFNFLAAFFFFVIIPLLRITNNQQLFITAEKVANWVYMFLVIGVLQNLYELKFHSSNLKTIDDVIPTVSPYAQMLFQLFQSIIIAVQRNVKKAVVIFLLFLAVVYAVSYIRAIIHKEQIRQYRLSLNPVITAAEPKIVYHSTKIILYGRGFDPRSDRSSVLKLLAPRHQKEDVFIDYVDNTKIVFTVPLHWNTGQLYFWVETPIVWEGKRIIEKSNVVGVRLIPRVTSYSPGFSPDDEAYFNQLKGLREETLRLNGYK